MKYKNVTKYIVILLGLVIISLCFIIYRQPKSEVPRNLEYQVINTYPHSRNSYTQGLFFDGEILYESTGSPSYIPQTRSVLGPLDLVTGEIDIKAELNKDIYFGEGSTRLKDKIYQLTYINQKGFVYDATTLEQINTFSFPSIEGWGLTTDGESLIMSDGTDRITYLNPQNFEVIKIIDVKRNQSPQRALNELEYVDGFIFANIYQTNQIVKINPQNGQVIGVLDFSSIVEELQKKFSIAELNGIAYRASTNTFFITGKLWPYIYEIRLNI